MALGEAGKTGDHKKCVLPRMDDNQGEGHRISRPQGRDARVTWGAAGAVAGFLSSSPGRERYWQVPAPDAALPVVMLAPVLGAVQNRR